MEGSFEDIRESFKAIKEKAQAPSTPVKIIGDAVVELQFNRSDETEFLEVTLEGEVDSVSLQTKEPKMLTDKQGPQQSDKGIKSITFKNAKNFVCEWKLLFFSIL